MSEDGDMMDFWNSKTLEEIRKIVEKIRAREAQEIRNLWALCEALERRSSSNRG